jgi:hypothetical protein
MRLWAISDLHVSRPENREMVAGYEARPDDWLAIAGDVGSVDSLRWTLEQLAPRFARLVWVPGNHDLWTVDDEPARGEERYRLLVEICRSYGALTPEDPYAECELGGERLVVAPLFLLYDYGFRRPWESKEHAFEAARLTGAFCADEELLPFDPHPSREAWCHARVEWTERRLASVPAGLRTVLVSHWPLRRDVVRIPRIPRFSPWCGTPLSDDWHLRFRAAAVVSGHLHVPGRLWRDGVPFSEVSLGYPPQWQGWRPAELTQPREIAPARPVPR